MSAYYDALKTKWATLSGTTAEKLAAINTASVAGPNVDVPISSVIGFLMLNGAFLTLMTFASGAPTGDSTHDAALMGAKLLVALFNTPNAPAFKMSDNATHATVSGMLSAILAQDIVTPGSTGITQSVHDGLLALAATTVPWWQGAYTSPIGQGDIDAAGIS